jgi:two-component sensor histidine kinase
LEQVAQYNLLDPTHNIHDGKLGPRICLDIEQSAIGRAVVRGIPVALPPDADAELGLSIAREGYSSMFCVPLVAPRSIMGGICLYDREGQTFSEEQIHLLDAFGRAVAIALENSRLYEATLRGLHVKLTMLQEMNHRVRNNLQTVAGLLSMQLRRLSPESEAATAIRESIARIQSMAAVHDLMVRGDVESTSIYELARQVAEAAISTLLKPGFDLKLAIDPEEAEHIRIGSHEATLLALLLNELVSNAILHGFANVDSGELQIRAWLDHEGEQGPEGTPAARRARPIVNIEVADNGAGLPEGFDSRRDAHLGLNIVRTMVNNDLRGEFHLVPGKSGIGTVARISYRQTPAP